MKKTLLATALLATTILTGTSQAADYKVDYEGAHAAIQFKIKHLGISWLTGRFNTFEGDFSYDKDKIEDSKVNMIIDVTSIDSNHAERDKHLKGKDFLNVNENPKATFVSKKVKDKGNGDFDLIGNLTLNGVTNSVIIDSEITGEGKDPWGGYRAGFEGTTTFALKDFGIDYDLGAASTHVTMTLSVEGIKK
jgi:polyisoprenoid-binding protein YceI